MTDQPDFIQNQPVVYPEALTNALASDAAEISGSAQSEETGADPLVKDCPMKEYYCGIRNWHPKWLQVFRNSKFFTLLLCLQALTEGALVSGFTSVVLSSIEKRYKFPSLAAGFIASTFDIAVLVSVLFISYFGGRGHKPRWLGFGLLLQGVGALIFSLPQFVFGHYEVGQRGLLRYEECEDGSDFSSDCSDSNGFALAFFIVGNLLIGVGAAPLFTVGTSYLDDIIHPKRVSIHLGLFYAITIVGPAMGYGLGAAFLSIYVDPWLSTSLEPEDPGWVGAWWMCFVFSGVLSLALSVPYFLFPRLLPDSHLVKVARQQEMAKSYKSKYGAKEEANFVTVLKTFPTHVRVIFTNLSWLFITFAVTASILTLSGMVSFAPKYMESQFQLTASRASLIAGGVAIPSGGSGVVVGALIIYFTKSKARRVALMRWIVSLFTILPVLVFLVHCPTQDIVGISTPYADGSVNTDLDSNCTIPCNCTSTTFEPVCGADDLTYFSPCRAGCDKYFRNGNENDPVFENCTCIAQRDAYELAENDNSTFKSLFQSLIGNSTAKNGVCRIGCDGQLILFVFIIGLELFLILFLYVPNVIITIRCVAEEQRTLALGLQSVVFRSFGSIPGPIIFGVIFDSACVYWQYECGRRGNCWVYDNTNLSQRALALAISGTVLNFIFSFLCWLVYPKHDQNNNNNNDDENTQREDKESESIDLAEVKNPLVLGSSASQDMLLNSFDDHNMATDGESPESGGGGRHRTLITGKITAL